MTEIYTSIQVQGAGLLVKETGIYEPASLVRGKLANSNRFGTSSINSSPSSSLETTVRSSQTFNTRAVQVNATQSITSEALVSSPGVKSAILPAGAWPIAKDIHESFISASLGTIVYSLCHEYGYVPLNSRTLIMTSFSSSAFKEKLMYETDVITLVTLDVNLTSLGTVVIKAHPDTAPGLQSLSSSNAADRSCSLNSGTPLLLAPGGNAAKLYGSRDHKTTVGNLPASHLLVGSSDYRQPGLSESTIQLWKSKCLEWLSTKGLNTAVLEEGGWAFVEVVNGHSPYVNAEYSGNSMLEDLAIVPWPALLCFQTTGTDFRSIQPLSMNPLAFAEEWFVSRDERAALILKRQKERLAAELKFKEQADVDARAVQSIAFSPAALRRGSNAGAMYPTPPDAIHHPVGATPSFDGAGSTPGQPNGLFSHDVDPPPQHAIPGNAGPDADMWGSSAKKDRATTSMDFNDNNNDNDNIFDSGAVDEMFGDITDITDADFNFFDVPDTVPASQLIASPVEAPIEQQETNSVLILDDMKVAPTDPLGIDIEDVGEIRTATENQSTAVKDTELAQNERIQATSVQTTDNSQTILPTVCPPFDMDSVFRRVAQESLQTGEKPQPRRTSIFDKVDFEPSLLSVNQKYGAQGRFAVSTEVKNLPALESPTLPKTQYLKRRKKPTDSEQHTRSLARILQNDTHVVELPSSEDQEMLYLLDSDILSQMSEPDDISYTTGDLSLILNPGVKRKWASEYDGAEDMASSFNALAVEYSQSVGTPISTNGVQMPLLEGDPADWALTTYFTSLEPDVQSHVLSDVDCIATAQILADQAVSSTIKIPGSIGTPTGDEFPAFHKGAVTKELMYILSKATTFFLNDVANCNMRAYLEIQGVPVLNQVHHRLPPRPISLPRAPNVDASRPWAVNPFVIPPPQLEVQRSDSTLSILPSAIHFWENLGLGPFQGGKNVTAICIYPDFNGMAENASNFLDQIQSAYESSRLGSHERLICKDLNSCLLPYGADVVQQTNNIHNLAALRETTSRLSKILSSLPMEGENFVVYFVYPVDNAALLVQICSAFQHLFKLYQKALSDRKVATANELVLQLLPLDFVASPTSLVVLWPSDYAGLAMEVYDRCIDFISCSSTPAILLEQPLPKNIEFKLTANPSASLLQEKSCLHIAYAQSIDDRWITAAWTDNRGTKQMTASYCLGRKNEPISTPFSDVANEIWETTLDILSNKKIHWRIAIARIGVMDPSESDCWIGLAATEAIAQINLTLLTVQTDPSLRLLPRSITLPPKTDSAQAVITPVSTPQAPSIVSPDTASTPARDNINAGTPGENQEPDTDARLIDYTDQSWGAILAHRLNNSNSLLEINPALISGYLLKRGGPNSDDPPIVMEVNIVHSEITGNPRFFHESVLRDILGNYRGLGTLARVRGVVDRVMDIRPWHIAAAEKAVKALYMLM